MSYPLLTKVLAEGFLNGPSEDDWSAYPFISVTTAFIESVIEAFPPDIADRLERALDVCQWQIRGKGLACGRLSHDHVHRHDEVCDMPGHAPRLECHPFQPLVTP